MEEEFNIYQEEGQEGQMPAEGSPEQSSEQKEQKKKKRNPIDSTTQRWYLGLVALGLIASVKMIYLVVGYNPDRKLTNLITPSSSKVTVDPYRGAILASDGSFLALATPSYTISMDCEILKDEYESTKQKEIANEQERKKELENMSPSKRARVEAKRIKKELQKQEKEEKRLKEEISRVKLAAIDKGEDPDQAVEQYLKEKEDKRRRKLETDADWRAEARLLAKALAEDYPEKTAGQWEDFIFSNRDGSMPGRRNRTFLTDLTYDQYTKAQTYPLWNNPNPNKSGMKTTMQFRRLYPYGPLATAVVGQMPKATDQYRLGIECRYDKYLKGTPGLEYHKVIDRRQTVVDPDSLKIEVKDGLDILTTIDIDMQQIAYSSLKDYLNEKADLLKGGCAIVMEVETGAIRALVDMKRTSRGGPLSEKSDYAFRTAMDPGSVFKAITLMNLLQDGKVKSLEETVPTHGGFYDAGKFNSGRGRTFRDDDLKPGYLQSHHVNVKNGEIAISDALKISSNNVFRELAVRHYGDDPLLFQQKLYATGLFTDFDFDLDGLGKPTMPDFTGQNRKGGPALPTVAIGYSVTLTPLHVATFYNGIANGGRMMRPYLIEGFMENGKIIPGAKFGNTGRGPLNECLCSKAVADTLKRGLRKVVVAKGGTAKALDSAIYEAAGKTGTARMVIEGAGVYEINGEKQNQGTFVGFWPYDNPKYTVIVVTYSFLSKSNNYGASNIPVVKNIINQSATLGVMKEDYGSSWPGASGK